MWVKLVETERHDRNWQYDIKNMFFELQHSVGYFAMKKVYHFKYCQKFRIVLVPQESPQVYSILRGLISVIATGPMEEMQEKWNFLELTVLPTLIYTNENSEPDDDLSVRTVNSFLNLLVECDHRIQPRKHFNSQISPNSRMSFILSYLPPSVCRPSPLREFACMCWFDKLFLTGIADLSLKQLRFHTTLGGRREVVIKWHNLTEMHVREGTFKSSFIVLKTHLNKIYKISALNSNMELEEAVEQLVTRVANQVVLPGDLSVIEDTEFISLNSRFYSGDTGISSKVKDAFRRRFSFPLSEMPVAWTSSSLFVSAVEDDKKDWR